MKHIIIGNSHAAIGAVEGIRTIDKTSEVLIISNEQYHTYGRPLISYLLEGKTDVERMKYRDDSFYVQNSVQTRLGIGVTAIDKDRKTLLLSDGSAESYDKLLVATGSSPFVPPMKGLETVKQKFTFMSLDDAFALQNAITKDSRVFIVGAGLIGMKCAEGIYNSVKSVTVADLADKPLSSILDKEAGEVILKLLSEKVTLKLKDAVEEFSGNTAKLKSGETVEFDVLVLAVGVRPNTQLFAAIGGNIDRGIITNDKQETSIADIYAAGDVAVSYDVSCGKSRILAILPNAYMQGYAAGLNMAGGDAKFENAIPYNAIGLFGTHIVTAGTYTGDAMFYSKDGQYKKLYFEDDVLKGFVIIDDLEKSGIYTSLVRNQTKLNQTDKDLLIREPSLAAMSANERHRVLSNR
jgi:NAD(P)H-nitrite reductase large subunit